MKSLIAKIVNVWNNMRKAEVKAYLNHRGTGKELEGIQPARYGEDQLAQGGVNLWMQVIIV